MHLNDRTIESIIKAKICYLILMREVENPKKPVDEVADEILDFLETEFNYRRQE